MDERSQFYIVHLAILALALLLAYWCFGMTNNAVDGWAKLLSWLGLVAGTIVAISASIVLAKEITH